MTIKQDTINYLRSKLKGARKTKPAQMKIAEGFLEISHGGYGFTCAHENSHPSDDVINLGPLFWHPCRNCMARLTDTILSSVMIEASKQALIYDPKMRNAVNRGLKQRISFKVEE